MHGRRAPSRFCTARLDPSLAFGALFLPLELCLFGSEFFRNARYIIRLRIRSDCSLVTAGSRCDIGTPLSSTGSNSSSEGRSMS